MLSTLTLDMALKWWDMPPFFRRKLHKIEIKNTFGSHLTTIWCLFMPKGDVRSGCFVWRRRWESFFLHFVTSLYLLKLDLHEGWNKCLFYLKEIISKDSKGLITFISMKFGCENFVSIIDVDTFYPTCHKI